MPWASLKCLQAGSAKIRPWVPYLRPRTHPPASGTDSPRRGQCGNPRPLSSTGERRELLQTRSMNLHFSAVRPAKGGGVEEQLRATGLRLSSIISPSGRTAVPAVVSRVGLPDSVGVVVQGAHGDEV